MWWLWLGRVRVNKRPSGVMAVSATSDAFRWLFSPRVCLRVASKSLTSPSLPCLYTRAIHPFRQFRYLFFYFFFQLLNRAPPTHLSMYGYMVWGIARLLRHLLCVAKLFILIVFVYVYMFVYFVFLLLVLRRRPTSGFSLYPNR